MLEFRVIPCYSIVENAGIVSLQGENSRIPDHGFLMFDYNLRQSVENFTNTSIPDGNKQEDTNSSQSGKKYKLQCIPPAFMTSTAVRNHLLSVIRIIETCRESQETIDNSYNELCRVIKKEMEHNIPIFDWSKSSR